MAKQFGKPPDHNSPTLDISLLPNVPPHNLEAERGVIGSMLVDPMIVDDVVILLSEDDFYSDANRRLYKHLREMRSSGCAIDLVLLLDRLQKSEEIEAIGGEAYIGELVSSHHLAFNAVYYAGIVREKSTLRQLIHTGSTAVQEAFAPGTDTKSLLDRVTRQMLDLCESQATNQVTDMDAVMLDAMSYIDTLMRGEHEGISTGFADLDENLHGGFRPNELIILAARPGVGKTALGMNIAEHVAVELKKTVLVVSLEMAKRELALRLLCSRGRIDSYRIRKNFLTTTDFDQLQIVANEVSQAPMFFDDSPSRTISEITAVARRLKRQNDLQLVVIDYLSLITADNSTDPRQEQVAKMARRLKGLARELHVPVLCLAQVNRQAEQGKETEPKLSNLRESGAIEQDADVVLFIHRQFVKNKTQADMPDEEESKIIVAKNRAGKVGNVKVVWQPEYTRFISKEKQGEEDFQDYADSMNKDFGPDAPAEFDADEG